MDTSPFAGVSTARLLEIVEALAGRKVFVLGDIIADEYLFGRTSRVSREAPVLILKKVGRQFVPGGAGNTANNLAALGCDVRLAGVLGDDIPGRELAEVLGRSGIDLETTLITPEVPTTTKTRILAGGHATSYQQVIRLDDEIPLPGSPLNQEHFLKALREQTAAVDAAVISDYSLGVVSTAVVASVNRLMEEIPVPVTVDSREKMLLFSGVTSLTPNDAEVEQTLGVAVDNDPEALEHAGRRLVAQTGCKNALVTRGNKGMALFRDEGATVSIPVFGTTEVADVTGAGDTVIATYTAALATGADAVEAMVLANIAGGLSVMKRGTATVSRAELRDAIGRG